MTTGCEYSLIRYARRYRIHPRPFILKDDTRFWHCRTSAFPYTILLLLWNVNWLRLFLRLAEARPEVANEVRVCYQLLALAALGALRLALGYVRVDRGLNYHRLTFATRKDTNVRLVLILLRWLLFALCQPFEPLPFEFRYP